MEKLQKEGYIRSLGVANCHKHHLEDIINNCEIKPVVDQFEVHPLFTQKELISYCQTQEIQVVAYSPLAQNNDRLRSNRLLKECAKRYGKSMQQIILRWHIQNGVIPIPRSTNYDRMNGNIEVFDFKLTPDEMKNIDAININSRLRYDPDNCDYLIL
jgi:diketogulonate reductase-like aldo/keto reductase